MYNERKGEAHFYSNWFEKNGYSTIFNPDIPFEGTPRCFILQLQTSKILGAGDALWAGKDKLFCGFGPRTDVRALKLLGEYLQDDEGPFKVFGCQLVDKR